MLLQTRSEGNKKRLQSEIEPLPILKIPMIVIPYSKHDLMMFFIAFFDNYINFFILIQK